MELIYELTEGEKIILRNYYETRRRFILNELAKVEYRIKLHTNIHNKVKKKKIEFRDIIIR